MLNYIPISFCSFSKTLFPPLPAGWCTFYVHINNFFSRWEMQKVSQLEKNLLNYEKKNSFFNKNWTLKKLFPECAKEKKVFLIYYCCRWKLFLLFKHNDAKANFEFKFMIAKNLIFQCINNKVFLINIRTCRKCATAIADSSLIIHHLQLSFPQLKQHGDEEELKFKEKRINLALF